MTEILYCLITQLCDGLLPPWLNLYETAFPPEDRVLVSTFLYHLRNCEAGHAQDAEMLAAVGASQQLLGIAYYEIVPEIRGMALWYIAVDGKQRGQGLGSQLYQELVRRAQAAACRALFFEVERPDVCPTPETRAVAERRIQFYRRNGACLLTGIHYLQSVGPHQPVTPMHLMVHSLDALTPEGAFALGKILFGAALCQTGELKLA